MKRLGVISYNIYCNFTNYGSALQSWAMIQAINKVGKNEYEAVLVDYCPNILKDKDPLNPFDNMWDKNEEAIEMCRLSMPAIEENYKKFDNFYNNAFTKTKGKYTSENFNSIIENDNISGFVCGSDTIFCIDEFGFDDGYYANYDVMKNGKSVAFAASFGDPHFNDESYAILNQRLQNFKAIALRENLMVDYVKSKTDIPVEKVIDPTLLLEAKDYEKIVAPSQSEEKYLLLYSRRYNPEMEKYAQELAEKNGWKVIEISLRATNSKNHRMFYEAGVEEFLSLVKNSEFVVTNSYHGMIFSVQFRKEFVIFSREQCDSKITELMELFGINDRLFINSCDKYKNIINYDEVHQRIEVARKKALDVMKKSIELIGDKN